MLAGLPALLIEVFVVFLSVFGLKLGRKEGRKEVMIISFQF
jgi:hypothetical protein